MMPETIALILVVLYVLAGLAVLFLGGRLIRYDLARAYTESGNSPRKPSRIIEDLRPFQNLSVAFFAHSEYFSRVLRVLARQEKLIGPRRSRGVSTNHIAWPAASIMAVAGLVRFRRRGLVLTDIGREVERRLRGSTLPSSKKKKFHRQSIYDALFIPVPVANSGSAHLHPVREALEKTVHAASKPNPAPASFRLGELRKPDGATAINNSTKSINLETFERTHMKKRTIIITAEDYEELSDAIAATGKLSQRGTAEMRGLETELARAKIVQADEIPADVITMNSRAELLDLETSERMEFALVFPSEARIEEGRISVLAPLGTAMLGYRVGDEFEWTVPYGLRRLKVVAVHFQPEAALALAA
jgi:regulator of nucleoside diphosphate kinase